MLATILAVAALASAGPADRPADLHDVRFAPTHLVYLYPGASVQMANADGYTCPRGGYYSDTSAYTWRGDALGPQHRHTTRTRWFVPGHRTQYVEWDGVTFVNDTHSRVLVTGWCE